MQQKKIGDESLEPYYAVPNEVTPWVSIRSSMESARDILRSMSERSPVQADEPGYICGALQSNDGPMNSHPEDFTSRTQPYFYLQHWMLQSSAVGSNLTPSRWSIISQWMRTAWQTTGLHWVELLILLPLLVGFILVGHVVVVSVLILWVLTYSASERRHHTRMSSLNPWRR